MIVVYWAVVWAGLGGFYLFLAGDTSTVEIVAAVVCASIGTALAFDLTRVAHRHFGLAFSGRGLFRPLAAVVPETFAVGRELLAEGFGTGRGNRGVFMRQPFDPGCDDDPPSATRRALVVLGVSFAPGGFVIRGDRDETMLIHALPAKPPSRDRKWPA